jgi:hypothetical protein
MTDSRAALVFASWTLIASVVMGALLLGVMSARSRASELNDDQSRARAHKRFRFSRAERCFMHKINHKRRIHGRRLLRWDWHIGYVARRHARRMARARRVWHDPELGRLVTRWSSLGQNTGGRGRRCGSMFGRFWASGSHRANILGRWRYVGVGVAWKAHRLYVQQVFEYRDNPGNVFGVP